MSITFPRAETKVVQSFTNLTGTSPQFTIERGYYWVNWQVAGDPNNPATVTIVENYSNGAVTLATIPPDGQYNYAQRLDPVMSGAQFYFDGAGTLTVVVANGAAAGLTIQG